MTLRLRSPDREISRVVERERVDPRPVVITGGAGFVGCNLAARLLASGRRVIIYDNISRPGVRRNVFWLRERFGAAFDLQVADVRDRENVATVVNGAGAVFHFAAQVAVTTSLADPVEDFCINAVGTINVLEAIRAQDDPPPLVFTSTNKVYGELADIELEATATRYVPMDAAAAASGVSEDRPLDFHAPYGCSKGAADQYVRDYARSFGLRTIVLRMSCVYGPRQFGNEDQGWLAHFLVRAMAGEPIVLYGDGRQVRDALYVDDLIDAMLLTERHVDRLAGRAFNIGGGPANTISLLELLERLEALTGKQPRVLWDDWRTGDQRYFVSDTRLFQEATGWRPRIDLNTGLARLHSWLEQSRRTLEPALTPRRAAPRRAVAAGVTARVAGRPE